MGAYHSTSNEQEYKIIQCAEPERDTIFHLHVTACRGRGSYLHDEEISVGAGERTTREKTFLL